MSRKIYTIEVEETVRVSVTYKFEAESKEDALARFKTGAIGLHLRDQSSDPEYIEATHYDTAAAYDVS